ncbi:SAM-dependent methyltransferase [Halanaeroarchaeum sulfurireducens]|uniref:FkbM family methyltransferase n=1 Tax=Halanaeroarchaeum sulfurireducens TaxID=1604004 RepID=A0A0F7P8E7_9EURY|nr:hypothetical protein [Halanaeroarchaeum sulfurireducens]AKH97436.1 hypothetical protein HLASF_0946 [Halanaeroarchaeum sulfurireducens]ALG81832.1 hypothetical protein HLASA_0935 [Halanaeroarchaeum sulfurireducens]
MINQIKGVISASRFQSVFKLGSSVVGTLFHAIRPHTHKIKNTYNDVTIERYYLIDKLHPYKDLSDRPQYEGTIVEETKRYVSTGDTVVILGGGIGVTTVHAAKMTGVRGEVYVYEGAEEMAELHSRTLELNPVEANIKLTQAIVGKAGKLWGDPGEYQQIKPDELPEADVYIIDIEGAEADVVPSLNHDGIMIIETHGKLGSPTEEMCERLNDKGYCAEVVGVAEPSMQKAHEEGDVKVVVAERNQEAK